MMELIEPLKGRRIALLCQPDGIRFRQFAVFDSPRSGHDTQRGVPDSPMRRQLQKLSLDVPETHR